MLKAMGALYATTTNDLHYLHRLGLSVDQIAHRMGRSTDAVAMMMEGDAK
jgi:hypothetical protein